MLVRARSQLQQQQQAQQAQQAQQSNTQAPAGGASSGSASSGSAASSGGAPSSASGNLFEQAAGLFFLSFPLFSSPHVYLLFY